MEKISVTIAKFLENEELLRRVYKEKLNAEKEVNRAMAGCKKNGTYTAADADVVLELMNKMENLKKTFEELSAEGIALKEILIQYLIWLSGSVDFNRDEHSIINFSLNDENELVIHPN